MLTVAQLKFLTFSGAGHEPMERVTIGLIGCGNCGGFGWCKWVMVTVGR